jgi:hypothetical protein
MSVKSLAGKFKVDRVGYSRPDVVPAVARSGLLPQTFRSDGVQFDLCAGWDCDQAISSRHGGQTENCEGKKGSHG